MNAGDNKAVSKGNPNGDYQKLGKPVPKEGPIRSLDKARVQSKNGLLKK